MMNDECGMMNERQLDFYSSFCIHHLSSILSILSIPVNFFRRFAGRDKPCPYSFAIALKSQRRRLVALCSKTSKEAVCPPSELVPTVTLNAPGSTLKRISRS